VPGNLHPPWQALIDFREHVREFVQSWSRLCSRLLARSRTDDFADRKILCCHGGGSDAENFTGCLPSERLRGGLTRARAGVSGSRPRTAVSDIKEQEPRAARHHTGYVFYRCSAKQPARERATLFSPFRLSSPGLGPFSMQEETKEACRGALPVRKHQLCITRPFRAGTVPGSPVFKGVEQLYSDVPSSHRSPCKVADPAIDDRSLRPTTHRFACADVPRVAGNKDYSPL
jgi:hypothetical protein